MERVKLSKEQNVFPKQEWKIDKRIESVNDFPKDIKEIRITNIVQNGNGSGITFNFIKNGLSAGHTEVTLSNHASLHVSFPIPVTSYYITLNSGIGDSTLVSFDLEFE